MILIWKYFSILKTVQMPSLFFRHEGKLDWSVSFCWNDNKILPEMYLKRKFNPLCVKKFRSCFFYVPSSSFVVERKINITPVILIKAICRESGLGIAWYIIHLTISLRSLWSDRAKYISYNRTILWLMIGWGILRLPDYWFNWSSFSCYLIFLC